MDLIQKIIARAKTNKQRIVLPEGTEERTIQAADRIVADGIADITLIGNPAEIESLAKNFGLKHLSQMTIVDPKNHVSDKRRDSSVALDYHRNRRQRGYFLVAQSPRLGN